MGTTPEEFNIRMSKKVAQLTKVIYHLNTKNEDNEAALKLSEDHHRLELLNLIKQKDATAQRITTLQHELDLAQSKAAKLAKQNQDISEESRSNEELQKALRDQAVTIKEALKASFEKQQQEQLAQVEARHEGRVHELQLKLEKQKVEQGKLHDARVEQMRMEHAAELAETAELRESRINELSSQLEAYKNDSSARQALVVKVSELEKTEAEAQRRLEEKGKKQEELKNQMARIEKANAFLEEKLTAVREEYEARIETLEATREEQVSLHQTHAMSVEERSSQHIQALESSLALYRQEKVQLLDKINGLEESLEETRLQNTRLSEDLSSANTSKAEAEEMYSKTSTQQKQQVEELRESLKAKSEAIKSARGALESHLADANRLRKDLLNKDEQISKFQAQVKGLKETVASVKSSKKTLKGKLSDATKTVKSLKEQLAQVSTNASEKDDALRELKQTVIELKQQLQAAEAAQASVAMEHSQLTLETKSKLEELGRDHDGAIATLELNHKAALAELKRDKEVVVERLKEDHRNVLSHLHENHQKTLQTLQGRVDTLATEKASLEQTLAERVRQLDDKAYAEDNLTKKCAQLETSLRTQEQTIESLSTKHDVELKSVKDQAQTDLKKAQTKADLLLRETESQLNKAHSEQIAQEKAAMVSLKERHASEILHLKTSLETANKKLQESHVELSQLLDTERLKTEALLDEARDKHRKEQEVLASKHKHERESLAREAAEKLEKEREEWKEKLSMKIKSIQTQAEEKHAAMEEEKRRVLERTEAAKSALRYELEAKSSEQRLRLMETHNKQMEEQRQSMSRSFDEKMRYLVDANTAQVSGLKKELTERTEELRRVESESVRLTNKQRDLEQEMSRTKMEWRQQCMNAEEAHKATLKNVVSRYERAEKELVDRHAAEKAELNQLVHQKNARIDAEKQRVEHTIREWKHKYEHRESRVEDVEEIRGLQEQLERYQAQCRKAVEEMSFFKRELLNREENYNKVFGRAPNVGIMQVVSHRQNTSRKSKLSTSNLPPLGTDQSRAKPLNNNSNNNREESRPKRPGSAARDRVRRYSVA